ncbi:hypothetical protein ACFLZR_01550 [Candidatus Neomarinimicrobiota bacterium]
MFRYLAPVAIIIILFAIILEGTYSQPEEIRTALQLSPTTTSRPLLVETSLSQVTGVKDAVFNAENSSITIVYNQGQVSLDHLEHILLALGYAVVPPQRAEVSF